MSFACIAVVGTLCVLREADIPADFKINHYEGGLYGSVGVSTVSWEVGATLYTDCGGCTPDRKLFSKACAGDDCITYYRHCDDAEHPTMCSYYFDDYPPIDVMAKTEEDFKNAVASIGIASRSFPLETKFPLSSLSTEAGGVYPYAPMKNYMRSEAPKVEGAP